MATSTSMRRAPFWERKKSHPSTGPRRPCAVETSLIWAETFFCAISLYIQHAEREIHERKDEYADSIQLLGSQCKRRTNSARGLGLDSRLTGDAC